ncbi:hypothetical protein HPB48_016310 [Haemaphysalis longicornis]|uniref:Uncharacterized protein n=1 Tax=Haemaphysalis longicornis TaxID=44386 RepID=A0A9J6FB11_HAELO|nr:hypothetical protein HPB48_016310 [Haemaphysalis longicornis]
MPVMRGDWASQGRLPPPGKKGLLRLRVTQPAGKTTKLAANPRCKLCGGPHPSGNGKCRNKYKTPFVVRHRQAASKERPHNGSNDIRSASTSQNYPNRSVPAQARQRSRADTEGKSAENNNERGRSLSNNRETGATVTSVTLPRARREEPRKEREADLLPAEAERTTPAAAKWPRSGKS